MEKHICPVVLSLMSQTMTSYLSILLIMNININKICSVKSKSEYKFNEIIDSDLIKHNDISTSIRFILMLIMTIEVYVIGTSWMLIPHQYYQSYTFKILLRLIYYPSIFY